jgi:hypothetical protein
MPLWRCPHCATPQAETARCWVCHRSSTACGACRHFRRSVAAQLGYCGLDRLRGPLTGEEIRPCWEAADATGAAIPALPGVGPVWPIGPDDRTVVPPIQFVDVSPAATHRLGVDPEGSTQTAVEPAHDSIFLPPTTGGEPRWSLWGEPEG